MHMQHKKRHCFVLAMAFFFGLLIIATPARAIPISKGLTGIEDGSLYHVYKNATIKDGEDLSLGLQSFLSVNNLFDDWFIIFSNESPLSWVGFTLSIRRADGSIMPPDLRVFFGKPGGGTIPMIEQGFGAPPYKSIIYNDPPTVGNFLETDSANFVKPGGIVVIGSTNTPGAISVQTDLVGITSIGYHLGIQFHPVPEPATMLLLGCGLIALLGFRKKFRKD